MFNFAVILPPIYEIGRRLIEMLFTDIANPFIQPQINLLQAELIVDK